ncbi:hypothetical protein SAMN04487896_3551 [Paenibacillus sp. ov031]|nr:hypothetical protein SAMN04487896_3551 [Paenibacillus sp. ov031]
MLNKQGFYDLLNRNNIVYESFEHPAVYTMEEIFSHNVPHTEHIVKNLFLHKAATSPRWNFGKRSPLLSFFIANLRSYD